MNRLGLYAALAGVLLGGCCGSVWCKDEIRTRPGIYNGEDKVYSITDEAYQMLQSVAGIREGRIKPFRNGPGIMFFPGDPTVPREEFYFAFEEADVDKNGIVDSVEAEKVLERVLRERFPREEKDE